MASITSRSGAASTTLVSSLPYPLTLIQKRQIIKDALVELEKGWDLTFKHPVQKTICLAWLAARCLETTARELLERYEIIELEAQSNSSLTFEKVNTFVTGLSHEEIQRLLSEFLPTEDIAALPSEVGVERLKAHLIGMTQHSFLMQQAHLKTWIMFLNAYMDPRNSRERWQSLINTLEALEKQLKDLSEEQIFQLMMSIGSIPKGHFSRLGIFYDICQRNLEKKFRTLNLNPLILEVFQRLVLGQSIPTTAMPPKVTDSSGICLQASSEPLLRANPYYDFKGSEPLIRGMVLKEARDQVLKEWGIPLIETNPYDVCFAYIAAKGLEATIRDQLRRKVEQLVQVEQDWPKMPSMADAWIAGKSDEEVRRVTEQLEKSWEELAAKRIVSREATSRDNVRNYVLAKERSRIYKGYCELLVWKEALENFADLSKHQLRQSVLSAAAIKVNALFGALSQEDAFQLLMSMRSMPPLVFAFSDTMREICENALVGTLDKKAMQARVRTLYKERGGTSGSQGLNLLAEVAAAAGPLTGPLDING